MKRRDFFELGAAMGAVLTAEAPRPNTRTCLARKEATAGAATSRSSDPLRKIAYAVATAGEGGGAPRGEELTFEEALRMYTLAAARGSLEEQDKGSIATGKLGDFAVLSADPRGRPMEELFELRVDATILGGEIVYER